VKHLHVVALGREPVRERVAASIIRSAFSASL
jgi:hypothetical protein